MSVPRYSLACLAIVLLVTTAHAQQSPPRDTNQVSVPTSAIYTAIARADTAALRPLLGNDLRWVIRANGAVADKTRLLAAAAHALPSVSLLYEIDRLRTWQHGDVATTE